MNINSIKNIIKAIDWYAFLYSGIFALLLIDYFALMSPSFYGLPNGYSGAIRIALGICAILRTISKCDKLKSPAGLILSILAGIGFAVYFGTSHLFLLDIALLILCSIGIKPIRFTCGLFVTSLSSLVVTILLAKKGYIRTYFFNGFNAMGFTKSYYAVIVIALAVISFILTIVFYIVNRKSIKYTEVAYALIIGAISVSVVFVAVLRLDRTRAIPDGSYTIYSGDSIQGIEMHMHGIENYDLSFDTHEATSFDIRWEGQYYGIYADTDGVERSLCVVDGELKLGDYDTSKAAHCWVIESMPNSPYFWIQNAETGYLIGISETGALRLQMQEVQGRIHEMFMLRLGDENLDYFKSISTISTEKIDISEATYNFNVTTDYTGEAVTGDLSLNYDGVELSEGRDYSVEYVNNYYPGQANVYVRGIGNYSGEIVINYTITIEDTFAEYSNGDKVQDYIFRAFRLGFNRLPTPEEFYEFKEFICITMQTPDALLWLLLDNGAFADSDTELVEGIYRLMLQRNGTRGEYDLWVNALESGTPRYAVIDEIVNSYDYQTIWPFFNLNFH
ncbi:MAG: hypothetical protein MJ094_04460 [Saccharofermentans sp.]|nr:hypothetical protein [Saccharofermentans sp.]